MKKKKDVLQQQNDINSRNSLKKRQAIIGD
jgi:hypothetical protein